MNSHTRAVISLVIAIIFLSTSGLLKLFKEVKRPLSRAEVIRQLKLKKKDKRVVKDMLGDLVEQGKLIRIRRGYGLADAMHCVTGRLEIQRGGFLRPDRYAGRQAGKAGGNQRVGRAVGGGQRRAVRFLLDGAHDDPLPVYERAFSGLGSDPNAWRP